MKERTNVTLEGQVEDSIMNYTSSNYEIITIAIIGLLAIGLVYNIGQKI